MSHMGGGGGGGERISQKKKGRNARGGKKKQGRRELIGHNSRDHLNANATEVVPFVGSKSEKRIVKGMKRRDSPSVL